MVRPRKYGNQVEAAAAKAEQDRRRYLVRQAHRIQNQVPRSHVRVVVDRVLRLRYRLRQ